MNVCIFLYIQKLNIIQNILGEIGLGHAEGLVSILQVLQLTGQNSSPVL